ncbi:50S ribosomal protein L4 [Candidatus Woesearchaeota archaeon]|nr:50S ribosomal protein L4P [uncultured archaeon]MBS3157095.1 50S ribosomal protein L4 [Candidatus Woesearchaeota archaeon]
MKAKIFNLEGKAGKEIELPIQFNEEIHPNLIKRAVLSIESKERQNYGAMPKAGQRSSAKLSKRRRNYRGSYGHGISRVPRKIIWRRGRQFGWQGAFAPGTVGGRRAHPPKAIKIFDEKINIKERRKAIRSALAASLLKEYVEKRHVLPNAIPIIVESKFESLDKTKNVKDVLIKLGLEKEMERINVKKVRAGKGKNRGRKYRIKCGPLLVVSKECSLEKAGRNLQGIEVSDVTSLNAKKLAPGCVPGRLIIWSEDAIERLRNEKLYTNNIVKVEDKK